MIEATAGVYFLPTSHAHVLPTCWKNTWLYLPSRFAPCGDVPGSSGRLMSSSSVIKSLAHAKQATYRMSSGREAL